MVGARRARLAAIAVLVGGLLAAALVLLLLLPGSHHHAAPPAPTTVAPKRAPVPVVRAAPLGAHSMLYSSTPFAFKRAMFAEAASLGVSEIRVDVDLSGIFPTPDSTDWSGLDDYIHLAGEYHLAVLADVTATPAWLANCPAGTTPPQSYRCGTDDAAAYGALAGRLAQHAGGAITDWEIVNEPDARWAFLGTPEQYARMLSASYDAIKAAAPQDRVLIGGIGSPSSTAWLDRVFAVPGADAAHKFDVANVHVRAPLAALAPTVRKWIAYFAGTGFHGPLWVTEHGYAADPAYQSDPAYRGGAQSQASYLVRSIPALVQGGAAKVFVTERDNGALGDASQGLLGGDVHDPPTADPVPVRRPAFFAVQGLARAYARR